MPEYRRNEDWKNIVRRLIFTSSPTERLEDTALSSSSDEQPLLSVSPQKASLYKQTSHLFVAGDLNYRTSIQKPHPRDHKTTFPQPNHPPTSQRHHLTFFENDQLTAERTAGRTLHGLTEMEITFPPTYKYNLDEASPLVLDNNDQVNKWNWAPHRWPSWCDRILYLDMPKWMTTTTTAPRPQNQKTAPLEIVGKNYTALPLMHTSDHRAVAATFTIPLKAIPPPPPQRLEDDLDVHGDMEMEQSQDARIHPPFGIDPDWKMRREQARRLEVIVGWLAYFTTTVEGGVYAIAGVLGVVGLCVGLSAIF